LIKKVGKRFQIYFAEKTDWKEYLKK